MSEKAKDKVLDLLKNDSEIRNAIIEICKGIKTETSSDVYVNELRTYIEQLEQENLELKNKNEFLYDEYKRYEEETKKKNLVIDGLETENKKFEVMNRELHMQYQSLYDKYSSLENIYTKYQELGTTVISSLERVLNPSREACESVELFLAYGSQENNLVALWETIATNVEYYTELNKIEDLIEIFSYFLSLYKQVTFKSISILLPNISDQYDERIHTRTTSSNVTGTIERVLLPGFSIGKNINKKALVIVR